MPPSDPVQIAQEALETAKKALTAVHELEADLFGHRGRLGDTGAVGRIQAQLMEISKKLDEQTALSAEREQRRDHEWKKRQGEVARRQWALVITVTAAVLTGLVDIVVHLKS